MNPRFATAADPATHIAATDLIDHTQVDWDDVRSVAYLIHQQFHYAYTGPIRDLRQRLVIIPPEHHGDQRLVTHRLELSQPAEELHDAIDEFGNRITSVVVDAVEDAIDFTAWIVIERERDAGLPVVPAALAAAFLQATALTMPNDAIRTVAGELVAEGGSPLEIARRICAWTYGHMTYAHGVTGVGTPASEGFALARGVCQDYAHIMIALCRVAGIPARYVSGHMLGEGGTHAWVDVLVADPNDPERCVAHAFDPTHDRVPTLRYLTIATGRDYGDVAPTSGTYVASHAGTLSASKQAGLMDVAYATAS